MADRKRPPLTIVEAARALYDAEQGHTEVPPLTDAWPDLDLNTGYRIQQSLVNLKIDAGEIVTGFKLGLTSAAKQKQMGVTSPLSAWLTDVMLHPRGTPVETARLIHPRVEPEIVFELAKPLQGPGVTYEQVLASVRGVRAGLEVIDSRYHDFRFKLPDVVADNASSALFVLGEDVVMAADIDLAAEGCTLSVNGAPVDSATGAAVQGHPARALATAVNDLATRGRGLKAGWTVLTGALTDAVYLGPGNTVMARFDNLGTVQVDGV